MREGAHLQLLNGKILFPSTPIFYFEFEDAVSSRIARRERFFSVSSSRQISSTFTLKKRAMRNAALTFGYCPLTMRCKLLGAISVRRAISLKFV